MNKLFLALSIIYICYSCENEEQPKNVVLDPNELIDTTFKSESILLSPNIFPKYTSDSVYHYLEKANVCSQDSNHFSLTLCNSSLFRVWPLGEGKAIKEGFICESRSLMFNGGVSKNVIACRLIDGKYKRVNHLLGKLLELKTTANGYYDLVMSYRDKNVGNVNVLHTFNGNYFDRIEVLELNDFKVKPEKKDSLYTVYLKDFGWGN